jgi:SGNH hydrolase-like domain, acetyltransferase AlgX
MHGHRTYSLLLIGLGIAMAAGFGLYGRTFEPLSGDLTRLGWYSENEFGWTKAEQHFDPPLAVPGTLDGRYDIIALGDSFTVDEATHSAGTTWTHELARDTGLRIGVFDSGTLAIDRLLASPAYREHPPIALVYETVERSLVPRHGGSAAAEDCTAAVPTPRAGVKIAPLDVAPLPLLRPTRRDWNDWPASYAINYLLQNAIRMLRGHETTSAVRLSMTEGGLFSSRGDRGLLVYGEDFNKIGLQRADWDAAACDLQRLQDRVQANGRTAFLAMIVPDKLTVYAPFLPYRDFDGLSHLDRLAEAPGLNLVRLGDAFDPRRTVDLYLPDDTHWSPRTHALAGSAVRDALIARGVLVR